MSSASFTVETSLEDYLALAEATGRCQHPSKHGKMPEHAPRLPQHL